ncbi:MAG: hypothetical protein GY715_07880 [Planctomycetes bacterium]|nr:hypothetical protein [Planctomycetota bacterium]
MFLRGSCILGMILLGGCSLFGSGGGGTDGGGSVHASGLSRPPAAAGETGPVSRDHSAQRVVVIGHFQSPPHPLQWTDVGPGMGNALARTLLNHGDFDVWINPHLARRVEALTDTSPQQRALQLAEIRDAFPEVRLVVTGRVTDFHHTTDVAPGVKRGIAVVAIQLDVFDLELGRVVASDHVHGSAPAPDAPSPEVYTGITFDSYLFWSSPLGKASDQCVRESMAVLNRVVPTRDDSIRIVRQVDPRRVQIAGGAEQQLDGERKYFVYVHDEATDALEPVLDRDTRLPLEARIERSGRIATTAWLLGEKPVELDLRGAVLREQAPFGRYGLAGEHQPSAAAKPTDDPK